MSRTGSSSLDEVVMPTPPVSSPTSSMVGSSDAGQEDLPDLAELPRQPAEDDL